MTRLPKLIAAGLAAALAFGAGAAQSEGAKAEDGHSGPGLFKQMDADGDGKITQEEMQARGQQRMKEADTDGDGFLSRDELIIVANKRSAGMVDYMLKRADTDKDGRLSEAELTAGTRDHDGFAKMDSDDDGAITQDEYREARKQMRHHRKGPPPGEDKGN